MVYPLRWNVNSTIFQPTNGKPFFCVYSLTAPPQVLVLNASLGFNGQVCYEVSGYPIPNRTWYFNNKFLNYSNVIQHKEKGIGSHSVNGEYKLLIRMRDAVFGESECRMFAVA